MVKIVTGKINDLKSTRLYQHYLSHQLGDGFISIKHMSGKQVHHYDALRLSTKKQKQFMIHEQFFRQQEESLYKIGPYYVIKETMEEIEHSIREMIDRNIQPIYLDEVGQLELNDLGYAPMIKLILENHFDLIMVVREDLIEKVINKFQIKDFEIVGE